MSLVLNVPFVHTVSYHLRIFHIITSSTTFVSMCLFCLFPYLPNKMSPYKGILDKIGTSKTKKCFFYLVNCFNFTNPWNTHTYTTHIPQVQILVKGVAFVYIEKGVNPPHLSSAVDKIR